MSSRTICKYMGITYPCFLRGKFVLRLWKRLMCRRGRHLLDEVWSPYGHCLYCDACRMKVYINHVEMPDAE